jgi:hypothetical protein
MLDRAEDLTTRQTFLLSMLALGATTVGYVVAIWL